MINSQTDKEFFEKIYVQHKSQMLWVANQVLQNVDEAEDAVHTVFVAIANNIEHIQGRSESEIQNYVVKAAKNSALNMRKRRTMGT